MSYRLICRDCSNEDCFTAKQDVTYYKTEYLMVSGEDAYEPIEYTETDVYDSDVNDGPNDFKCDECSSRNVLLYDEDNAEEYEEAELIRNGGELPERSLRELIEGQNDES